MNNKGGAGPIKVDIKDSFNKYDFKQPVTKVDLATCVDDKVTENVNALVNFDNNYIGTITTNTMQYDDFDYNFN